MSAHSISSRSRVLIICIIIPMYIQISPVLMIRQSLEPSPDVRVDLDFCYSVRYHTNFLGEINCSSDVTVYNSQIHGLIQYSPEQGWQFLEKPFVCMCSCNFNTKDLRNGSVIGNGVVSHESYLNYTCHPGFKKITSSRIICLDGIFVSVESDDNVELPESITETSTIFRKYPLSNKYFSKLSNSVYEFVIDSDSWICNNYPAQKEFVYKFYNSKVPYKLLSNQEETCYKDGNIDFSRRREIGCIEEITDPFTSVDSVHQNITHICSVSIVGVVIFITVGIVKFYLARRKVSKALQKRSIRECDPQLSSSQQESAPTCSFELSFVSRNKCSSVLSGSGELYATENKHLFYSKSGNCRIACLLTPKILRKTLSSNDLFWTIHSKYLEDDCDDDEHQPEDSERPQCSNMTENKNSWSRHISKRSKSESNVSVKDLQSRNLYTRSHSDSIIPFLKDGLASASTAMKENNARVVNEDQIEKSSAQLERINEAVEVRMKVMNERTNLDDDSKSDKEDVTLHKEDNDERETSPLMAETNDMKHDGSSVSMLETGLTKDGIRELQNRNGCTLGPNNSKSDMTLARSSSRDMDPASSRWKSDPYIFSPSLLEKAWRSIKKKFFRRKDSHFQSFLTRIEIDCI